MQQATNQQQAAATPAGDVTIFEDESGRELAWEPGIAQVPFSAGAKLKIAAGGKTLDCTFVEQRYDVTHAAAPRLYIVVKRVPPNTFANLDPETKDFIRFAVAFCILLATGSAALAIYASMHYPTELWGLVGYHLRWFGFVAIGIVGFAIVLTTKGYAKEPTTFAGQVLGLTYSAILLLMCVGWWYVTIPPKPLVAYPGDYADYAQSLWKLFNEKSGSFWIATGWLAGVFKLVGWTNWSTGAENIAALWKKFKGE